MKSLIKVSELFDTLSSRVTGAEARQILLEEINQELGKVVIDFNFQNVSPSFADEFIGIVANMLGREVFKSKIGMVNVSNSSKLIIKHVISRRLSVQNSQSA
jgi:hypothetical protein